MVGGARDEREAPPCPLPFPETPEYSSQDSLHTLLPSTSTSTSSILHPPSIHPPTLSSPHPTLPATQSFPQYNSIHNSSLIPTSPPNRPSLSKVSSTPLQTLILHPPQSIQPTPLSLFLSFSSQTASQSIPLPTFPRAARQPPIIAKRPPVLNNLPLPLRELR